MMEKTPLFLGLGRSNCQIDLVTGSRQVRENAKSICSFKVYQMKELEGITSAFVHIDELIQANVIHSGHINDSYEIQYRKGSQKDAILLQRLNHAIFQKPFQVMENIQMTTQFLEAQTQYKDHILKPLLANSKQLLHQDHQGNYWRAFPFFKNSKTILRVENEKQAYEAARAFGAFMKGLENIEIEKLHYTIPDFHNGLMRLEHFKIVIQNADEKRLRFAKPCIQKIFDAQDIFSKVSKLKLPLRVTHNDTKISNVLFDEKGEKAICVIDLDTVMPGIVLSDFGDMVRTFTNAGDEDERDLTKVEIRKAILEALTEGFLSAIGNCLTQLEKENLMLGAQWITLMQAMRFLTDYLQGDVYYRIAYPEHNLIRTKVQLKLFRQLWVVGYQL